jgi:hypothetical protein
MAPNLLILDDLHIISIIMDLIVAQVDLRLTREKTGEDPRCSDDSGAGVAQFVDHQRVIRGGVINANSPFSKGDCHLNTN